MYIINIYFSTVSPLRQGELGGGRGVELGKGVGGAIRAGAMTTDGFGSQAANKLIPIQTPPRL